MIIGKDIFPNVFINNIEVYKNKIKYDVMVFDTIQSPTWSNKPSLEHKLKLKHAVLTNVEKIDNINNGAAKINRHDSEVKIDLVSTMAKFEIQGISNLKGQVCYKKTCVYTISESHNNIGIFANIFIEGVDVEAPIASERVMVNGSLKKLTNVLLKSGEQYYGPVHYHDGSYMEGRAHKPTPHSKIDINTVINIEVIMTKYPLK